MISMKDVNLSKRMEAVVSMVSPQSFTIADVGCDHAYVSIALVQRNLAKKMIAMDVRTGPLDIAKRNVTEAGLANQIDIRLGDGLEKLQPGEADVIIIAGMGGLLIKGILERGMEILNCEMKRPILILQPQSDLKEVRMFLRAHAYDIACEDMLEEDGKYYTIIKAEPISIKGLHNSRNAVDDNLKEQFFSYMEEYTEEEWEYGKYNLLNQNKVLLQYLEKEKAVLKRIEEKVNTSIKKMEEEGQEIPFSTLERSKSVTYEKERNEKALQYYLGVKV